MAKSVLYNIFNDLTNAVKSVVEAKYIFLKDRPSVGSDDAPMAKFVVIDLPLGIEDYVIGSKKSLLNTVGVFYIFTRAKNNNTLNLNATGDIVDNIVDLFPIKGDYCSAANPIVRMTGSDGQGFQVTTISFDIQTKWKAFDK